MVVQMESRTGCQPQRGGHSAHLRPARAEGWDCLAAKALAVLKRKALFPFLSFHFVAGHYFVPSVPSGPMPHFSRIRTFVLELEQAPGTGAVYHAGELLSGQVVLEAARGLKVRSLLVCARGLATTHWLEGKSVGMSTVYSDYTAHETYLRRRLHLIRGESCPRRVSCPGMQF
ncbi:arrestin domain-containing protein 2-like [Sceloporus undulatus]|uniref:arrestin domain-containing protein 2-like n=1 Tax=Sceloporus undulatus TaxID=8520 RepID=UPI001C4B0F2A|nr:arrestin domain-containing protein 2-like [Sceloporus undulatus]